MCAALLWLAGCGPPIPYTDPTPEPTPGPADAGPPDAAPRLVGGSPFGPPAVAALPADFPDPPADLAGQLWAAPSAPTPGLDVDVDGLRATLRDPTDKVDTAKRHAAVLLGAARAVPALPELHEALVRERGAAVKAAAAEALGAIGDPRSVAPLWTALQDHSSLVRVAAIGALGRIDHPTAVPPLAAIAGHRGVEARAALLTLAGMQAPGATEALAGLTAPGVGALLEAPAARGVVGATIHVDATAGDDGNPGSAEAPLRTLGAGVRALRPGAGDVLLATAGDQFVPFREEVDVLPHASGLPGVPTVLKAWPGRPPPVLDGALASDPQAPGMAIGLHVGASWVRIEGFTVRRYRESGIDLSGSVGNVLVDCTALDCERHGLFVYYSADATLLRPTVRRCAAQGISVRSSPRVVVAGGLTEDNGIDGLLFLQDSDDAVVHGLVSRRNARGIAFTTGSNRGRVLGVTLEGNRDDGLVIEEDADATRLE